MEYVSKSLQEPVTEFMIVSMVNTEFSKPSPMIDFQSQTAAFQT
jgi:hypothetical protein